MCITKRKKDGWGTKFSGLFVSLLTLHNDREVSNQCGHCKRNVFTKSLTESYKNNNFRVIWNFDSIEVFLWSRGQMFFLTWYRSMISLFQNIGLTQHYFGLKGIQMLCYLSLFLWQMFRSSVMVSLIHCQFTNKSLKLGCACQRLYIDE